MTAPTPDAELLQRLRAKDESAFAELVDRLHGPLVRLARSILGDASAADEVVQDAWTAALQGLAAFEGRSSLKTWLFSIVLNRARSRRERDQRQVPASSLADEDEAAADPDWFDKSGHWKTSPERWSRDTPERVLNDKELRMRLNAALEQLPERFRAVLVMRDVEGQGSAEVCNALGLSESNQRVLLHRARTRMRTLLGDEVQGEKRRRP